MKSTLPWLCSLALTLALTLSASAQDFAILDMPEEPELSFALFGESDTQLPSESLDFAVLDPCDACDCEKTGVCICEKCTCPGCPNKKNFLKTDPRPLITVRTMPNCPPCLRCKADSKTEALADFRFVFVESENGPAPIVEWQGAGRKCYFEGWHGPSYFLKSYEYSQQPRTQTAQARPIVRRSYVPVFRPQTYFRFNSAPCPSCR